MCKCLFQWPKAIYGQELHTFPIQFTNSIWSVIIQFIECHYNGPISGGHLSVNNVTLSSFTCSARPGENFVWDDRFTLCIGH